MQLELLCERLAQRAVIIDDQYFTANPHHFPPYGGAARSLCVQIAFLVPVFKAEGLPRRSRTCSHRSADRRQSGRRPPAARAPAAKRTASAGFAITRRSARASAAASPAGTSNPASRGTVSGIAPAVVAMIGRPCAIASAKAIPYPS